MKKHILVSLFLTLILSSIWAAPKGVRVPDTIDKNIPEDQLAKVIINKLVAISQIDEYVNPYYASRYSKEPLFDKSLNDFLKVRTFYLLPGEHTLDFYFRSNVRSADGVDYTVTLEAGKTYELIATVDDYYDVVFYDIQESQTHTSLIPGDRLTYKQQLAIEYASFLEMVEKKDYTFKGNTVKQNNFKLDDGKKNIFENSFETAKESQPEYIIEYGPDMTVKYTEKEKEHEGFIGFDAINAVIYIKFNDDGNLTKDEFLNLQPDQCDKVFNLKTIIISDKVVYINLLQGKKKEIVLIGY